MDIYYQGTDDYINKRRNLFNKIIDVLVTEIKTLEDKSSNSDFYNNIIRQSKGCNPDYPRYLM